MFGKNKYSSKNIAKAMGDIQAGLVHEREEITKKLDDLKTKKDKAIKEHELAMKTAQEKHDKEIVKLDSDIETCRKDMEVNVDVANKVGKVLG